MLISSWLKSFRNQLSSPRRTTRRKPAATKHRGAPAENLEARTLLAAPTLVAIRPNVGEFLIEDEVRDTAPNQLTLQFNPGQQIDNSTLANSISVTRAGHDTTFGDGNEVPVSIGFVGIGDLPEEVVVRFAENLPDDHYRINIAGAGAEPLRNLSLAGDDRNNGEAFNNGVDLSFDFSLDLGARIVAVDPQPITRATDGTLSQARDQIVLYFNEDDLDPTAASTPELYQLVSTQRTVSNLDDVVFNPTVATYNSALNTVTLTFAGDIDTLDGEGTYRLRVGNRLVNDLLPVAPTPVTPATDAGSTRLSATTPDLGTLTGANASLSIAGEINITTASDQTAFPFDFPGAEDEPGHREIEAQSHFQDWATADANADISKVFYNFNSVYTDHPANQPANGGLGITNANSVTPNQQQRAREIFGFYGSMLGIDFVETDSQGLTIATGDPRVLNAAATTGVDGVIGISALEDPMVPGVGLAIINDGKTWNDEPGGDWFQAAMREIGTLLGLGDGAELPEFTINSGHRINGTNGDTATFGPNQTEITGGWQAITPTGPDGSPRVQEPDFPGDHDIVHGLHLHRSDNFDIDRYNFDVTESGIVRVEVVAERLANASDLDARLKLFRVNGATEELIAQNDDYFSEDSFIELLLEPGDYSLEISSTDNGAGGTSSGEYNLRVDFTPSQDETNSLFDADLADSGLQNHTLFDGDGDGIAGGVYNFWFNAASVANTLIVDKVAAPAGDGSLGTPFRNIDDAIAIATPGQIVRILGNDRDSNGDLIPDGDTSNDLPYLLGQDQSGNILPDGETLNIPRGVTVMIDAGAIIKLRSARIGVGSSQADGTGSSGDRSRGALQVLGTPDNHVIFTSLSDESIGTDTTPIPTNPTAGDWGGLSFRNDIDESLGRFSYRNEGIFINHVGQATLLYGGGNAKVDTILQPINPISTTDAHPTVAYNVITSSADSAISANADSFEEYTFHSSEFQEGAAPFTSDYTRVGPDIQWNVLTENSTNGLFIRVDTAAGSDIEKLTVPGRFDDLDVVHVVAQNLEVQGTPGGAVLDETAPDIRLMDGAIVASGGTSTWGAAGDYSYRVVFVDGNGFESPASDIDSQTTVADTANDAIELSDIPAASADYVGRRIYRSEVGGGGVFTLVAQLDRSLDTWVDNGGSLGGTLTPQTSVRRARTDASLVIDPGVIVKLEGSRIQTGIGAQLIAEGDLGREIIFTSRRDDRYGIGGTFDTNGDADAANIVNPAPGDWAGLYIGHLGSVSIDRALFSFAGGVAPLENRFETFNTIEVHQAEARIRNSVFIDNADGRSDADPTDEANRRSDNRLGMFPNESGTIFVRGSQPVVLDNQFEGNAGPIISINANSLNSRRLTDPGRSTGPADQVVAYVDNQGPLVRDNSFQNNGLNGMEVRGEIVTTQGVWDDTDIAHILFDEVYIPDLHVSGGVRLESTATESLVVKFGEDDALFRADGNPLDIDDRIGGMLHVIGQPGKPVVLTSLSDDTAGAGFDLQGFPQFDTNNDGDSAGTPGDWQGVVVGAFAHDRNVGVYVENELGDASSPDTNGIVSVAEVIGQLAAHEFAGDDTLRLGFEVHGTIDSAGDADVYSFFGTGGQQVWLDIDDTANTLDSVIELLDSTGNIIASSDNDDVSIPGSAQAFTLDQSQYISRDLYTLNPLDAGMRVVLPGANGATQNYFVRVRSNDSTVGSYELSVRLRELDEFPGTTIQHADIRFATNGIQLPAAPLHSPLVGEFIELNQTGSGDNFGTLLNSDRAVFSVAGVIDDATDSDQFLFTVEHDPTQQSPGDPTPVPVVFDLDFADGQSRANTMLAIYIGTPVGPRELIAVGGDSNITEDRQRELAGDAEDTLDRGSYGEKDPFIGPFELLPGDYYVQVLNNNNIPTPIEQFFISNATDIETRAEPIPATQRIAEDRFDAWTIDPITGEQVQADTRMNPSEPITDLFEVIPTIVGPVLDPQHNVDFHLGDVTFYATTFGFTPGGIQSTLHTVNPFTGAFDETIGRFNQVIADVAMRPDGQLHAFQNQSSFGAAQTSQTVGNYLRIDTATGATQNFGDDGITANLDNLDPTDGNVTTYTGSFFEYTALSYIGAGGQDLFAVGSRSDNFPLPNNTNTAYPDGDNVLWRLDTGNGAVVGQGPDRVNDARATQGAGTTQREVGEITAIGTVRGMANLVDPNTNQPVTWVVDDAGFLYNVNRNNAATSAPITVGAGGINFRGLSAGPGGGVDGGAFSEALFGVDNAGVLWAFGTDGTLLPAFANGATSVQLTDANGLPLTGATGIAFSTLQRNLWATTSIRGLQDGHGVGTPQDGSQAAPTPGGTSLYFGNQSQGATAGNKNTDGNNRPQGVAGASLVAGGAENTVNFPGGAHGSIVSNYFDLSDYSSQDKPVLYFNYFLETENAIGNPLANQLMRDSFRVFVQDPSGRWNPVATNNSWNNTAPFPADEFDQGPFGAASTQPTLQNHRDVVETFDNTDNWRQARVDLSNYAGIDRLRLRFDFTTAGSMNLGDVQREGHELYAAPASTIDDGHFYTVDSGGGNIVNLEFDLGPVVHLPSGALADGHTIVAGGQTFTFTPTPVAATDIEALVTDSAADIAAKAAAAINAVLAPPPPLPAPPLPPVAFVVDNRLNLPALGASSSLTVVGADGVIAGHQTVPINIEMDSTAVAVQMQEAMAIAINGYNPAAAGNPVNDLLLTNIKRNEDMVRLIQNTPITSVLEFDGPTAAEIEGDIVTVITAFGPVDFTFTATPDPLVATEIQTDDDMTITAANFQAVLEDPNRFPPITSIHTGDDRVYFYNDNLVYTDAATDVGATILYTDFSNSSPLGLVSSLSGDSFGAYQVGTVNNPGTLKGANNNVEGLYIDDIVIGFAERGEVILNQNFPTNGATSPNPNAAPPNTAATAPDIVTGAYDVEIRRTADYATWDPAMNVNAIDRAIDTNDRETQQTSITVPVIDDLVHQSVLTISDGIDAVTFEFVDVSEGPVTGTADIVVTYNPTTEEFVYDGTVYSNLAVALRDAINSAGVQSVIDIAASMSDGATDVSSNRTRTVHLSGVALVTPDATGRFVVQDFDFYGDQNHFRDQGQIIVDSSIISDSLGFGILADAPLLRSTRTLLETNPEYLVPGVVLVNNLLYDNAGGGIQINGNPEPVDVTPNNANTRDTSGLVTVARIVNNTIVGPDGSTSAGIDVTNAAAPSILNNIIANYNTWISVSTSSQRNPVSLEERTVIGSNLYRLDGSNNTGILGNGAFPVILSNDPMVDPLFVDEANHNYYISPASRAADSGLASLLDRPALITVKDALGIGLSPTLAPEDDIFGQVRSDDPTAPNLSGQGGNVFVDRGAIDRVDFADPTVVIVDPLDQGVRDLNPNQDEVLVNDADLVQRLTLRLEDLGVGIDDLFDQAIGRRKVFSGQFELYVQDVAEPTGRRLLVEDQDYIFQYNAFTKEVTFLSVTVFPIDRVYEIWVKNTPAADPDDPDDFDGVRDLAGNFVRPNQLDGTTKFFIALSNGRNDAPVNTVPDSQILNEDTLLTFGVATGIPLSVVDQDVALGTNELTVTLGTTHGTSTPVSIAGITTSTSPTASTKANRIVVGPAGAMIGQSVAVNGAFFTFADVATTFNPAPNQVLVNATDTDAAVAVALANLLNHPQNFDAGTASAAGNEVLLTGVTASDSSDAALRLNGATLTTVDGATSVDTHIMVGGHIFRLISNVDPDGPAPRDIAIDPAGTASDTATAVALGLNTFFGSAVASSGGTVVTLTGVNTEDELITLQGDVLLINRALDGVTFLPDPNYHGPASVTMLSEDNAEFTISGRVHGQDMDVVTINVTSVNDNPLLDAIADRTIDEDTPSLTVNLSGIHPGPAVNTPPNEAETIRVIATSNNTAIVPDPVVNYNFFDTTGSLDFSPVADAFGTATITVSVEDAGADGILDDIPVTPEDESADNLFSVPQQFDININAINDAPTLNPIPDQVVDEDDPDQVLNLTGISAGPGGESESILITAVSSDTSIIPDPVISYTPGSTTGTLTYSLVPDAFGGPVTITVTVQDAGLNNDFNVDDQDISITETFTIVVNPINDLPTIDPVANQTHPEDGGPATVNLTGITNGAANENEPVIISAVSSNPAVVPNPTVFYNYPNTTGVLTYEPLPDAFGITTITLVVTDGGLDGSLSNTADNGITTITFDITIEAVNDPPTIDPIGDVVVAEDSAPTTVNFSGITNGPINETEPLRVVATSSNTALIDHPTVSYTSPQADGSLTFQPEPDQFGVVTITVAVTDAGVDGVFDDNPITPVDESLDNATVTTTFDVTVTPVNDAPLLDPIANQAIDEDTGPGAVNLTGIAAGPANETEVVRLTAVSSDPSLVTNPVVTYTSPDATGVLNYDLVGDAFGGPVTLTVTVEDAGVDGILDDNPATLLVDESADNLTTDQSFEVLVNPVNDPPTIDAIADLAIDEDSPSQTVPLSGITNGPPNETESVTVTAISSNPALIANPAVNFTFPNSTGSLSFTPLPDQHGVTTITVVVTDAGEDNVAGTADDLSTSESFLVTVNPVNDQPTVGNVIDVTLAEDSSPAPVTISGIGTGAADEVQDLRVTASSSDPTVVTNLQVTYSTPDATATLAYDLVPDAFGGPVTITVNVEDAGLDGILGNIDDGLTSTTFDITVTPVNDPPTIDPLTDLTVSEDAGTQTVSLTGVTNGPSNESEDVMITAVSSDTSLIADPVVTYTTGSTIGTLTYTPTANQFGGPVTITVTVQDAGLNGIFETGAGSDDQVRIETFDITVEPLNDSPTLNPISPVIVSEDSGVQVVSLSGITAGPANELEGTNVSVTVDSGSVLVVPSGGIAAGQVITVNGIDFTYVTATPASSTEIFIFDTDTLVTKDSTLEVAEATALALNAHFGAGTALANGNTVNTPLPITTSSADFRIFASADVISTPLVNYTSRDATGLVSFTPLSNAFGVVRLTVTVSDFGLDGIEGTADDQSTSQPATVFVNAVNDPPEINSLPDLFLPVDAGTQMIDLTGILNGPISELENLRISVSSSDTDFIPQPTLAYSPNDPTGTITLTPAAGMAGASNITILVEDAGVDGVFSDPLTPASEEADNLSVTVSFRVSTAPIITSPVGNTADNTPLIQYTPITASAGYEVRLFNVTEDLEVDLNGGVTVLDQYQITNALPLGEYRVDVRALDAGNNPGLFSQPVTFVVAPPPVIETPVESQLPDSTPTFSWGSVLGAEYYTVTIVNDVTDVQVFSGTATATQLTVPDESRLPLGRYRYTISAVNNRVITSNGIDPVTSSTTQLLTISTPPEVLTPLAATYNNRPTVTWTNQAAAAVSDVEIYNVTEDRLEFIQLNVVGTSYTLDATQALSPGEYRVQVRSFGDVGRTVASDYSAVSVFQVGTAPQLLGPTGGGFRTADPRPTVSWEGSLTGETYSVWLTDLSNGEVLDVKDGLTTESFQHDTDLGLGRYRYWARATTANEQSRWSSAYDFEVVTPPTLTQGLSATFETQPTFTWQPLKGAVQYRVWVNKTDQVPAEIVLVETVTDTSLTMPEELANGKYRVWVQGISDSSTDGVPATVSNWSAGYDFEVGGRPRVTHAALTDDPTPTLTWEPVGLASSYEIYFSAEDDVSNPIVRQSGISSTSFTIEEAVQPGSYRFWVRAFGPTGQPTPWSLYSTSYLDVETVTRPTLEDITSSSNRRPQFVWNAVANANRYHLYVSPESDTSTPVINQTSITATSYAATADLAPGVYRAWVKAITGSNESSGWSVPITFTILADAQQQQDNSSPNQTLLTSVAMNKGDWEGADVSVSQIPARVVEDRQVAGWQQTVADTVEWNAEAATSPQANTSAASSESLQAPVQASTESPADESGDELMADWDREIWAAESSPANEVPSSTDTSTQSKTGVLAGLAAFAPAILRRRRKDDK